MPKEKRNRRRTKKTFEQDSHPQCIAPLRWPSARCAFTERATDNSNQSAVSSIDTITGGDLRLNEEVFSYLQKELVRSGRLRRREVLQQD